MIHALKLMVSRSVSQLIARETAKHLLSIEFGLRQEAQAEAIAYIHAHMAKAKHFSDRRTLFEAAINEAPGEGSFLEFGVYRGYSINIIASLTDKIVHRFDSFEGLPESWGALGAGHFSLRGKLPRVRHNVKLHKGWFSETMPEVPDERVAFLHIDCDLYNSTKTVLDGLSDRIAEGTVIIFDEYFNYIGWKDHEFRAFQEFGRKYHYLGYSGKGQVAVVIE